MALSLANILFSNFSSKVMGKDTLMIRCYKQILRGIKKRRVNFVGFVFLSCSATKIEKKKKDVVNKIR